MASPITSVQPCDVNGATTGDAVTTLPTPSKYVWHEHDISSHEAGRTEDLVMHKMLKGKSLSLDVEWPYPTLAEASTILKAFDSEYFKMTCIDAKEGTLVTRVFYVGDRISPLWNNAKGRWESVGFSIIQQTAE